MKEYLEDGGIDDFVEKDLGFGERRELGLLVTYALTKDISSFNHINSQEYQESRRALQPVQESLFRWCAYIRAPRSRRDPTCDFLPAIVPLLLNWMFGVHDLGSLLEATDRLQSCDSELLSEDHKWNILRCLEDLREKRATLVDLNLHRPDKTQASDVINFLVGLGFSDEDMEVMQKVFITMHVGKLKKYYRDIEVGEGELGKIDKAKREKLCRAYTQIRGFGPFECYRVWKFFHQEFERSEQERASKKIRSESKGRFEREKLAVSLRSGEDMHSVSAKKERKTIFQTFQSAKVGKSAKRTKDCFSNFLESQLASVEPENQSPVTIS